MKIIELPENVEEWYVKKEFAETNGDRIITLDMYETEHIDQDGLDFLVAATFNLIQEDVKVQFVDVREEVYPVLMNGEHKGNRLITLADVFTDRSKKDLQNFYDELLKHSLDYDLTRESFIEIFENAGNLYRHVRRNESPSPDEDLFIMEYGIMRCIRNIEEGYAPVVDFLGYKYGDVSSVNARLSIVYRDYSFESLEDDNEYLGRCIQWDENRGFGFVLPFGMRKRDKIFVHRSNSPERPGQNKSGLIEGCFYTVQVSETQKGWAGRNASRI